MTDLLIFFFFSFFHFFFCFIDLSQYFRTLGDQSKTSDSLGWTKKEENKSGENQAVSITKAAVRNTGLEVRINI